jgi:outer membrane protein TolC
MKLPVLIVPGEIFGQPGSSIPVEFGTQYNVTATARLTQLLYSQSYFTTRNIAKKATELAVIQTQSLKEEIAAEVAKLYWYSLATNEQVNILEKNIINMEKLLKISRLQFENGMIKNTDLQKMEVNRNNLLAKIRHMQNLYSNQINILKFVMNLPEKVQLSQTDSMESSYAHLSVTDMHESLPDLRMLSIKSNINRLSIKAVKQEYLPTLSIFGSYAYQSQRDEFDMFSAVDNKWFEIGLIGINLSIPVFDGLEKHSRIQMRKIDLEKTKLEKENAQRHYKNEWLNATIQWENIKKDLDNQKKTLQLAEEVYGQTRFEYLEGISSLTDLVIAQNNLLEAESICLQSLLNLRIAEVDLIKASGNIYKILNPK